MGWTRPKLRKSDLLNPVAILAVAGLVTWICFSAVLAGTLGTWVGGVIASSAVALVFLYGPWVRSRTRRAREELYEGLRPSSDPADHHQVYTVLRPLRHYDCRIRDLLDLTDSYAVGVVSWSNYRDEVLATMDDIVGEPHIRSE